LEAIWHFTGRFTPQGNIGKYPDQAIEAWVEWDGEPGALISGLTASGWLNDHPVHRIVVHDWAQHADKATKNSLHRSGLKFCVPAVRTKKKRVRTEIPSEGTVSRLPVPVPVPEPEAKAKAAAKDKPLQFALPEWIQKEVWNDFEEMRRKIRAPLTDRARKNIVAELVRLEAMGNQAEAVLNRSITNSWRGVFPLDNGGAQRANEASNGASKPSPAKQRVDANRAALAEAVKRRGLDGTVNAGRPDGVAVSESGPGGIDGRLPAGLRASGPEILPPAIQGSARFATHQAGTDVLSAA
jgi:hypothetical protein